MLHLFVTFLVKLRHAKARKFRPLRSLPRGTLSQAQIASPPVSLLSFRPAFSPMFFFYFSHRYSSSGNSTPQNNNRHHTVLFFMRACMIQWKCWFTVARSQSWFYNVGLASWLSFAGWVRVHQRPAGHGRNRDFLSRWTRRWQKNGFTTTCCPFPPPPPPSPGRYRE